MFEKLERTLGELEEDLEQDPPPEPKSTKKVKKVAKKKAKKVAKKVSKSDSKPKGDSNEGKVTLAELASEAGITTASARRRLRAAELSREGRWAWDEGSKSLKEAQKALGIED